MKKPTVTLWYFEFCTSGLGIWDRQWAESRTALERERRALKRMSSKLDARITPDAELDGSQGQHGPAHSVEVELSAKGILDFANEYAIDQGAC